MDGETIIAQGLHVIFTMTKYSISHRLETGAAEAGVKRIGVHDLRYTFCTRMANAGMNPKALQYIMGHANITMTLDYYTHVDACSVKAEMERLAA